MNNREAFEAWAIAHGGLDLTMHEAMDNEKLPFMCTYYNYTTEIAWRAFANKKVPVQAALASQASELSSNPLQLNTDSAREYLVENLLPKFSDSTFAYYVRNELAGDFAYQLAVYLQSQAQQDHIGDGNEMVQSQAQQTKSQWISVDESLPEMETPVVALVGKNVYALARVDYDEGWLWAICGRDLSDIRDYEADDDYQPTYWMPLAIPPAPEYQEPTKDE